MRRDNTVRGVILVLLGVFFLASNFGWINWGSLWKFWPLILVAVGVSMLMPKNQ